MRKQLTMQYQSEPSECGLICLAMILGLYGKTPHLPSLRQKYAVGIRGTTLSTLVQIATDLGFRCRALRFDFETAESLRLPCVLHWGLDHFVVLEKCTRKKFTILDPARGRLIISRRLASDYVSGVALEISPLGLLAVFDSKKPLRLWHLVTWENGTRGSLFELLIWTALLQGSVAALPLFSQIALDAATRTVYYPIVASIGIGLISMIIFRIGAELLRSSLSSHLAARLSVESRGDLFARLHQLPIDFFQRQNVAMLMTRFQILTDLLNLNTEGAISVVLDGAMCSFGILVLLYYSVPLGLLACGLCVGQIAATLLSARSQRNTMFNLVTAEARASSVLLDSLRSITSTKVNGSEHGQLAQYLNALIEAGRARIRKNAINMLLTSADTALLGGRMATIVLIGVSLLRKGEITIGALFAFAAYQELVASHLKGLLGQFSSFAGAGVQLDMIDDIVSAEPERFHETGILPIREVGLDIALLKVSYRYSPTDPFVLTDISIDVRAGECVAIVGSSGSGKSTLLRILMGLVRATGGQITVDSQDPWLSDIRQYRRRIAAVMQDDQLQSGTIRENICCGELLGESERVMNAATQACVLDDILRMPMGFLTRVGDMGTALSAGQKQRILLARALYRNPTVLFLDEATGNVDLNTEQNMVTILGQLPMTRIVVTHRPEILRIAHRIYELKFGCLELVNR